MSSKTERLKPKRREVDPVRRTKKGQCVSCRFYELIDDEPCLWKLEGFMRKGTLDEITVPGST